MDMFLVGKGFVGFQNYIEAFADKRLWNSLWVTVRGSELSLRKADAEMIEVE